MKLINLMMVYPEPTIEAKLFGLIVLIFFVLLYFQINRKESKSKTNKHDTSFNN